MANEQHCLTCNDWYPIEDFRLEKGGKVFHSQEGIEHVSISSRAKMLQERDQHMSDDIRDIRELLVSVRNVINIYLGDDAADKPKAAPKPARGRKTKPEPEPTEDEKTDIENDAEEDADEDAEAALQKMTIAALRKRALALGFEPEDVKSAKKPDLIEAILEDMAENGDSEDSDDDDDEDAVDTATDSAADADDDDEEGRRSELESMTLPELRKLARSEPYNAKPSDVRSMDKEALIDLLLDAEADDDSDSVGDDPDADDDEDGYTRDELQAMDLDELKEIYSEWGLDLPAKKVKPALIKGILDAQ